MLQTFGGVFTVRNHNWRMFRRINRPKLTRRVGWRCASHKLGRSCNAASPGQASIPSTRRQPHAPLPVQQTRSRRPALCTSLREGLPTPPLARTLQPLSSAGQGCTLPGPPVGRPWRGGRAAVPPWRPLSGPWPPAWTASPHTTSGYHVPSLALPRATCCVFLSLQRLQWLTSHGDPHMTDA